MSKPNAFLPDLGAEGMQALMGDALKSVSGLNVSAEVVARLQRDYVEGMTGLWNQALQGLTQAAAGAPAPALSDRRFAAKEWADNPAAYYNAQMYLLNARTLMQMAEAVEGDAKTKQRIRFALQQWVDAAAPSNYLALNPEAQRKALDTRNARSLEWLFDFSAADSGTVYVEYLDPLGNL